ncbi:hypothetical protein, variant 2 [Blastomyces gilchristii SLH14081]|uniref:Uncharacterized protein n=1 Tax=Blastomyces gilchristii (strain SLH14081) TaxID=559298 RepID=A0A179UVI9_BLAGS|nr:uncharacterized protein BDBG_07226 [Blastomyces gilchristii SLH14081]XP_031580056.1 hypothetical protein, variant 1 [Blastomyces gilchristii SLH14081]XP_031580057.1 hypothetical protein, variant 2 [Blastomyces gilchristii SLH14081]OAT11801.1 hypothetical protein BDBG_07226 [Blastomyces gilchristii SLH14081]OAT11802.1 hypothetical protein, variant 1 [Blastomyces gilchristii SLH14081]OAT11803.1 hypothetical protein, variant 2 [Blastomyces gilchristii SLH14081]
MVDFPLAIPNIPDIIDRIFQRRMEVPAGKYSGPGIIMGHPTISVTTFGPSLIPTRSGAFPSAFVTSISTTSMDKSSGTLGSRDLGPGIVIGSCTWPTEDTTVTDSNNHITVYSRIVCRDNEEHTCCPVEGKPGAPLSACPQGYVVAEENACCPTGWSVFTTLLGTQTPCYSQFSTVVPPVATASVDTDTTTIRTALFAKKYDLVPSQTARPSASPTSSAPLESPSKPSEQALSNPRRLNEREIVGIVIGSACGALLILGVTLLLLRRWKRRQNSIPKITVDDLIRQPTKGTHELAPTDNQYPTKQAQGDSWTTRATQSIHTGPANSNPHISMAYSTEMAPTIRAVEPQELPGNTFINEYHPAYRNDPCPWRT